MAGIADVARAARVSPATVSRVLNDVPTVDRELAVRVRAAARRLDYRPNVVARNLRRQRTDVVALIISDIGNPFFTSVARGAEDVGQREGFSVLLCNADEDPAKEARYLAVAQQEKVAGVVLSPNHAGSDVSALRAAGIPVCVIDRPLDDGVDVVRADSRAAAHTATAHLLAEGWRRPACITGPRSARTAADRAEGYRAALTDAGRPPSAALVRHADFRSEQARQACAALLDARRPPDALFVANATMALGVLAELARRGMRAGRDLGVIAIDDAPWAPFVDPPLSVVTQPAYDIGACAVELLLRRVTGDGTARVARPREVVMDTELVVRASSRRTG